MAVSRKHTTSFNSKGTSGGGRALIVICLLSVLVLTFYIREGEEGPVHSIRSGVMTLTSPVRMLGSVVASPFNALGRAAGDFTADDATLSELKKENAELTAKVAELSEAQETADRLQGLLDLKSTYNLKSTAARIIGASSDAWTDTVTIDKGSSSGFKTGMPVCGSGGVIGQIVEVSANTSTVRLISDDESSVSAMVQASRAQGVLQGQPDGTLRLSYVVADADVKTGDIVITSGLGGNFPKGLPLGTVTSVSKEANAVYYTIVVRPLSSAENDEEVLVVTSVSDDQKASDEDVASANAAPQGTTREQQGDDQADGETEGE